MKTLRPRTKFKRKNKNLRRKRMSKMNKSQMKKWANKMTNNLKSKGKRKFRALRQRKSEDQSMKLS
jgi:hypothetical protein